MQHPEEPWSHALAVDYDDGRGLSRHPVTPVEVHGVTGLLVGQPGFPAKDQWTGSVDESAADWPGRKSLVWKKDGVDFRVEGPDAATVVAFARALSSSED